MCEIFEEFKDEIKEVYKLGYEIVKAKAQISAISGRIIDQKVQFLGKKQIMESIKKTSAFTRRF